MRSCPHCLTKSSLRPARYDVSAWQVQCPACAMAGPEAETREEAVRAWDDLWPPYSVGLILCAYGEATAKHPGFPADIVHAAAILAEEAGEVVKAALDRVYAGNPLDDVRAEVAQVGAMALRMLVHMEEFMNEKSALIEE